MEHIHDKLDYLKGDEIIFLNDKYLTKYYRLGIDDIEVLIKDFKSQIKHLKDKNSYTKVDIKAYKQNIYLIDIKVVHLYELIINCLEEIKSRKARS